MMRVGGRSNQRFRNSSSRARYEDHRFPSSISVEYKVVDRDMLPFDLRKSKTRLRFLVQRKLGGYVTQLQIRSGR